MTYVYINVLPRNMTAILSSSVEVVSQNRLGLNSNKMHF